MLHFFKLNRKTAFCALAVALLFGVVAGINIYVQNKWSARVRTWKVISAEVRYNNGTHAGYVYRIDKKEFLGKSVTYGLPLPADKKKGTDIPCIINPDAPGESAALVKPDGFSDHLRRFRTAVICIPLCLVFLGAFITGLTTGKDSRNT